MTSLASLIPYFSGLVRNRRLVWGAAFTLIFAGVFFSLRAEKEHGLSRRLLIADRDVPAGSPVTSFFFGMMREVVSGEPTPSDAVSDQELHLLKGTLVNLPIRRGEILRRSHLKLADPPKRMSEQIPLGSRAYLLEVHSGITSVKPGDKVDVLVSSASSARLTVVENIVVLEVHGDRDLTLAVTVAEMENLELARGQGTFGVVLRNPKDSRKGSGRFQRVIPGKPSIPVFYEGRL